MADSLFTNSKALNVLDKLTTPLLLLSNTAQIEFANQAFCKLLSANALQPKSLKTMSYFDLCQSELKLPEDQITFLEQAIQELLDQQRQDYQLDYPLPPDLTKWFRMTLTPFGTGVQVAHHDISDYKRSEARAELLLESPLDALLLIDSRGLIQLSNNRLEELFGYTRDELFGQRLDILLPHRFRRQHKHHLDLYFNAPGQRRMGIGLELYGMHKDGHEFPVEISLNPIHLGDLVMASAAIRDVSQLKQSKADLERLARILESSANEIALFDAKSFRLVYANKSSRENLGYSEKELKELTPLDILPDYSLQDLQTLLTPLQTREVGRINGKFRVHRKDGSSYPTSVNLQFFADENPPLFMVVATDDSEQERLGSALQESQKRRAEHIENTPIAVIEWRTSDQLITSWNPAAESLFGYKAEEVVEKASPNLIVPDELKSRLAPIWKGEFDASQARSTNTNISKEGRIILCEWYNTALKNRKGDTIGVASFGLDVTARQRALDNMLNAQEEERGRIARDLHDQVGQSLTGLVLTLSNDKKTEPTRIDHYKAMTTEILEDVRRISRDLRPALLDEIGLEPALKRLARDINERHDLHIDLLLKLPGQLKKDQQIIIYRVIQEALTNTVRHARASHVSIILSSREGYIQLMVEDDGIGFEPTRVATTEHIGLAGMQERIELAGGTLTIESEPGEGTRLSARFPQRFGKQHSLS